MLSPPLLAFPTPALAVLAVLIASSYQMQWPSFGWEIVSPGQPAWPEEGGGGVPLLCPRTPRVALEPLALLRGSPRGVQMGPPCSLGPGSAHSTACAPQPALGPVMGSSSLLPPGPTGRGRGT